MSNSMPLIEFGGRAPCRERRAPPRRRSLRAALALALMLAAPLAHARWTDTPNFATNWYDGVSSAYTLNSEAELAGIAVLVNNNVTTFTGVTLTLASDVDLSAHAWTAIGTSFRQFRGTFDGGRRIIANLWHDNASLSNQGLFGYVGSGGVVRNVCLTGTSIYASARVGGIVGYLNGGTVENCDNAGTVYAASINSYAGGIVGYAASGSTIRNCSNYATVEGENHVGGILGYFTSAGDIRNTINRGTVTGTGSGAIGGIAGTLTSYAGSAPALANVVNIGVVDGSMTIGGVVGSLHAAVTAGDCYWIRPDAWQNQWNAAGSGAQPTNSFYFSEPPGTLNGLHPGYATSNLLTALNGHVSAHSATHPQLQGWTLAGSQDGYPELAAHVPVAFDANGGTGSQTGITAVCGSAMPAITVDMAQSGYVFDGYFDQPFGGSRYYNADGTSARKWDRTTATTLYAQWTPVTYTVAFDPNGGSGSQTNITAAYMQWMPDIVVSVTRTGYWFDGYFDAAVDGKRYYRYDGYGADSWDKTNNATLYAQWLPKGSTIEFVPNEGEGWQEGTWATYDQPMTTLAGIDLWRTGYSFTGFFDAPSGGTRYYNADGSSARVWDREEQWVELYAQWTPAPYTLSFDASGGSGTQTNITVYYGSPLPQIAVTLTPPPGYAFDGFSDGFGNRYYDAYGTGLRKWDLPYDAMLSAEWVPATYTASFDPNGGSGTQQSIEVTYLDWMPDIIVTVSRTGYWFDGYFDAAVDGTFYYWSGGWGATSWDKTNNATLYAQWWPTMSDIFFNPNGGDGWQNWTWATYDQPMMTLFSIDLWRTGYSFTGFFDAPSGGTRYYNADGSSARVWDKEGQIEELYAQWAPNPYTLSFHASGGSGTQTNVTVYYESPLPQIAIAVTLAGHTFHGYANADEVLYYNAEGSGVRDWDVPDDGKLYAQWRRYNWSDPGYFTTNWYDASAHSFVVSNAQQLAGFAVLVNAGASFTDKTVTQTADIDLSGRDWTPAGDGGAMFTGTFDGGGHTISAVVIRAPQGYSQGLFGRVLNGVVKRVHLTGTDILGAAATGAIAGTLDESTLRDCSNEGSVSGSDAVGGLVGMALFASNIANCINRGSVDGTNDVGGIIGQLQEGCKLVNCANAAAIKGVNFIGGLVGYGFNATVFNSVNRGDVTASDFVGGLIGGMSAASAVHNSFNTARVQKGAGGMYVGGVTGAFQGMAQNSHWRSPDSGGNTWPAAPAGVSVFECEPFGAPPGTLANPSYGTNDLLAALNARVATLKPTLPTVWGWTLFESQDGYPVLATESLVYFHPNGGVGQQPEISAAYGSEMPLLQQIGMTRTGYRFAGYHDAPSDGTAYYTDAGESARSWDKRTETTLYAQWTPNTYTVTYDGNGASGGSTADSAHTYDLAANLTLNGFARTGYRFTGWALPTHPDPVFSDGEEVLNLTDAHASTVTLFACWTPVTYTVTYHGNGPTSETTPDSLHTYDTQMALSGNGYTRTGYTFSGWAVSAGGGVVYQDDQEVTNLADNQDAVVDLYAVWTANTYTVTFDTNDGSGAQAPVTVTYDAAMPPLQVGMQRTGWSFDGYFDAPDGGTRYYNADGSSAAVWDKEANTLLFAQWTRILWSDPGYYDTDWYDSGQSAFILNQAAQLAGLAVLVNAGNTFADKRITLANALDLHPYAWVPIGTAAHPFCGEFDGRARPITGISVEHPLADDQGFFGYAGSKSLFENVNLTDAAVQGQSHAGILAGRLIGGTARNCQVSGTVTAGAHAGGLIGTLGGVLRNSLSIASVVAAQSAGGLAGTVIAGIAENSYWLRDEGETGLDWDAASSGAVSACFHFLTPPGTLSGEAFQSTDLTAALNAWVAQNLGAVPALLSWTTYNSPTGYPRLAPVVEVTFDLNNGSGNQPPVTAVYGAQMPDVTVGAVRSGYTFQGYFSAPSGGSRYSHPDGTGAKIWDKLDNSTLHARWTVMNWADPGRYDTGWHDADPDAATFVITTPAEMAGFAVLVNRGNRFAGRTVLLAASFSLSGSEWSPVGSDTAPFLGLFEGSGHTIADVTIDTPQGDFKGLFGYVGAGATVRNLRLVNTDIGGQAYVGGVVGWLDGELLNVANNGRVGGAHAVGGLAGILFGTIANCANYADVEGLDTVGGVVGFMDGTAVNTLNSGSVTGAEPAGGVAGERYGVLAYGYWRKSGTPGYDLDATGAGTPGECRHFTTPPGTLNTGIHGTSELLGALNEGAAAHAGAAAWTLSGSATGYPVLAIFDGMSFTVTFDANGGSGTQPDVTADYGAPPPEITPALSNGAYTFTGFFDAPAGGVRYYHADGTAARIWDKPANTVLYAQWADGWIAEGHYNTDWYYSAPLSDRYYIGTTEELAGFAVLVNGGNSFKGIEVVLTNHLDLAGLEWTPIGSDTRPFQGTFEGSGKSITGLTIDNPVGDLQGLFGCVGRHALIYDLKLTAIDIRAQSYVGAIVGWLDGAIVNCASDGEIRGDYHCGGIAGVVMGSVINCHSDTAVTGGDYVGGVVGFLAGTLENCYSSGAVTGLKWAGGIAGETASFAWVKDCYWKNNGQSGFNLAAVGLGNALRCHHFGPPPGTLNALHPLYATSFLLTALNEYAYEHPALSGWTLEGSATGYPVLTVFQITALEAIDPPPITTLGVSATHVAVTVADVVPGATYVLEKTRSLTAPDWQVIGTAVAPSGAATLTFVPERLANEKQAFYRVKVQ